MKRKKTPTPFASAWDERLGRSTVREFGFKGSISAEGVFSASLSCDSVLGPAVDRLLRSEDPQFFRVDATAVAALRSFDVALAGLAASSGRPEPAASSSSSRSPAVGLHYDLEQGSSSDLAQVGEGEDNIPMSDPPTPTPVPAVSSPTPLPTSDPLDDDSPGGGPCTHPEYEEDPGVFIDDCVDDEDEEPSRPPPPPPPSGGVPSGPYPLVDPRFPRPTDPTVPEDPDDVFIDDGDEEETTQEKSRDEWGTGPPAAATTSRQVVSNDAPPSRKGSDCVSASSAPSPSAPPTVNSNYNDKSGSGGKAPMRPEVATAAPIAVPGRFGRGFGRKPDLTPTAGGIHHDCRTFGCFRQAAGPTAETAAGEIHCCLMCFETDGGRHSRECDGGATLEAPRGTQRPWAPGAPRDNAGGRTDVPLHMDESDDPTGMDEVEPA